MSEHVKNKYRAVIRELPASHWISQGEDTDDADGKRGDEKYGGGTRDAEIVYIAMNFLIKLSSHSFHNFFSSPCGGHISSITSCPKHKVAETFCHLFIGPSGRQNIFITSFHWPHVHFILESMLQLLFPLAHHWLWDICKGFWNPLKTFTLKMATVTFSISLENLQHSCSILTKAEPLH
jgi:hypothetical protein